MRVAFATLLAMASAVAAVEGSKPAVATRSDTTLGKYPVQTLTPTLSQREREKSGCPLLGERTGGEGHAAVDTD